MPLILRTIIPMRRRLLSASCALCALLVSFRSVAEPSGLRVLFLGDNDHHRPHDRFVQLEPVLTERGIKIDYTSSLDDLNPAKLAGYDCLLIYANHTKISPSQEQSLLDFVKKGGGL